MHLLFQGDTVASCFQIVGRLDSTKRFFTMTGTRWKDCADEIVLDNGFIQWVFNTYIKPKTAKKSTKDC